MKNAITTHKKREALRFGTIWNWKINFILRRTLQLGESYWLRLSKRLVLSQGCPGRGGERRARNTRTGKTQLRAASTEKLTNPL